MTGKCGSSQAESRMKKCAMGFFRRKKCGKFQRVTPISESKVKNAYIVINLS